MDVEGLDGVFVGNSPLPFNVFNTDNSGPYDLSISLGIKPMGDLTQVDMVAVTKKVLEGCKKRGKVAMLMVGNAEIAKQKLEEGWNGVFPGADVSVRLHDYRKFESMKHVHHSTQAR